MGLRMSCPRQVAEPLAYEVHGTEGRVCARLGYGAAGCVLLARAFECVRTTGLGSGPVEDGAGGVPGGGR